MIPDIAYAVAYIAAAAISVSVGIAALRRRPAPGSIGLMVLSFAHAEWSGAFALQWTLTDHEASLIWLAVRNFGLFVTPIAILALVTSYVGKESWFTRRRVIALSIVPALGWFSIITDPWHGLYLAGVEPVMKLSSGGPMFLLSVAYSYGLILFATGLLLFYLFRRPQYSLQAAVLLIAVLLPVVHFAAQLAGFDLLPRVNSVPFTFTVSGALMWYALARLGLFRLVPVARDQLIEQLPVGIVVFDADRRIIDSNPAAARMTGAAGIALGRSADEAFPQQLDTVHRLREALLSSDSAVVQAEFAPDLWIEAAASVVNDRAGERIATLVTLTDVSEHRAAERMQRDFIANVAHELQTPLTGLSLLARTIPQAMRDDPHAVSGFVDRLGSEVNRLVHLTDELITLSRADALSGVEPNEPVDVLEVVSELIETVEPIATEKRQSLEILIPTGILVTCDAHDLGAIIGNLLQNAVRYTGAGGRITASAEHVADSAGTNWVTIRVSDNGIGIPSEEQGRVFERFYRVDKARSHRTGGAGLGLSIVRQLVRKYGGSVTLVSEPGQGSTFTVRLPGA